MSLKDILNFYKKSDFYPLFFTLVFVAILSQQKFNSLETLFYDAMLRLQPNTSAKTEIVFIRADEESATFLGEVSRYSYATLYKGILNLLNHQPKLVVFNLPLKMIRAQEEYAYRDKLYRIISDYQARGGVFRFAINPLDDESKRANSFFESLGWSYHFLTRDTFFPPSDLKSRRVFFNVSGQDTMLSWFSEQYAKLYDVDNHSSIIKNKKSKYQADLDASYVLFKYTRSVDAHEIDKISFHHLVSGSIDKSKIKDKAIWIGSEYASNLDDYIATPLSSDQSVETSKSLVSILTAEALILGELVNSVSDQASTLISFIIAIFLSFYISKLQPTKGLFVTIITLVTCFICSYLLFVFANLWVKMAHILLSIFVVYYIWIPFRAIGEYQTRYALQEESKMLKKVDRLKQNFISLMSHDLKTPVAKLAGIADILLHQTTLDPNQRELVNKIETSTHELNNFITSILDLTKVESRKMTVNFESKDINKTIEKTIASLQFEARTQSVKIEQSLEPLYPIKFDAALMERVLSNLIGNAIKYAGKDSKVIVSSYDDENWVYVTVKDNGRGIPKDDLEHIFEKFYRVKNDDSHKIKGSGLGLYLVKYFVELQKGEIKVESEVGQGTMFTIKFINA